MSGHSLILRADKYRSSFHLRKFRHLKLCSHMQASTLFMCEMLVTSVWPAQCGDKLDCINPSFLPNAMEPVPPLCCDSLRQRLRNYLHFSSSALDSFHVSMITDDRGANLSFAMQYCEQLRRPSSCQFGLIHRRGKGEGHPHCRGVFVSLSLPSGMSPDLVKRLNLRAYKHADTTASLESI